MKLIESKNDIINNLMIFQSYKDSKNAGGYFKARIKSGKIFVVGVTPNNQYIFCPSRFAGYKDCSIEKHIAFDNKDGKLTTPQISKILGKNAANTDLESHFLEFCDDIEISPDKKERTYWLLNIENLASIPTSDVDYPDESSEYTEGKTTQVYVNAYERNKSARVACINHHGFSCCVCGFNFEEKYGHLGKYFIHVHHIIPLASIKQLYKVDPTNDLRPVCPNCHAMLHKSNPPFSIEELKIIISNSEK